jgi:hypothetical protein
MLERIFPIEYQQYKTKQLNIKGRHEDIIIIFQQDVHNKANRPDESMLAKIIPVAKAKLLTHPFPQHKAKLPIPKNNLIIRFFRITKRSAPHLILTVKIFLSKINHNRSRIL